MLLFCDRTGAPQALHISMIFIYLGLLGIQFPANFLQHRAFGYIQTSAPTVAYPSELTVQATLSAMKGPPDWKAIYYMFPSIAFVSFYSILPHKVRECSFHFHFLT